MKNLLTKTLFISLLLSTATPSDTKAGRGVATIGMLVKTSPYILEDLKEAIIVFAIITSVFLETAVLFIAVIEVVEALRS